MIKCGEMVRVRRDKHKKKEIRQTCDTCTCDEGED